MREILFRGKRVDNGTWEYGAFVPDVLETLKGVCGLDGFIRRYNFEEKHMETLEVERETVGQYTGLKDKNGVKIFEGDIVVWDYDTADIDGSTHTTPEAVRWDNGLAAFAVDSGGTNLDADCRVIGNIHDNPELMEEAQL